MDRDRPHLGEPAGAHPGDRGLDNKAAIPSNAWVEYDVTAAVSGNGTYSFVLQPESDDGANFHSRESPVGGNPPQLVVESGPIPTPTPMPTPDPNADPVVMAAGDNVCGADSTSGSCKQMATSDLLVAASPQAVLVLGDVQYECGEASDFTSFYDPSWGRVKADQPPRGGQPRVPHQHRPGARLLRQPAAEPRPTSTTSGRRPARWARATTASTSAPGT